MGENIFKEAFEELKQTTDYEWVFDKYKELAICENDKAKDIANKALMQALCSACQFVSIKYLLKLYKDSKLDESFVDRIYEETEVLAQELSNMATKEYKKLLGA